MNNIKVSELQFRNNYAENDKLFIGGGGIFAHEINGIEFYYLSFIDNGAYNHEIFYCEFECNNVLLENIYGKNNSNGAIGIEKS